MDPPAFSWELCSPGVVFIAGGVCAPVHRQNGKGGVSHEKEQNNEQNPVAWCWSLKLLKQELK